MLCCDGDTKLCIIFVFIFFILLFCLLYTAAQKVLHFSAHHIFEIVQDKMNKLFLITTVRKE